MKTIIVPTDFSAEATNAFRYAVEYALTLPEAIHLYLLYVQPDRMLSRSLLGAEETLTKSEAVTRLEEQILEQTRATGLRCSPLYASGSPTEEIVEMAQKYSADMIIMGTKGAQGVKAAVFGSNTANVISLANCPVLAVPEEARFRPLKQIVFASNFSDSDVEDIRRTVLLGRGHNASLVLLHLSQKGEEELDRIVLDWIKTLAVRQMPAHKVEVASVQAPDFTDYLDAFLVAREADLLVMTPKKRTFFQQITRPSKTRRMAMYTSTPLLALPEVKEPQLA